MGSYAEKGQEPVNGTQYASNVLFAIVWLAEKSRLQILERKLNGIFGIVTEPCNPAATVAERVEYNDIPPEPETLSVGPIPIEEIKGNHFITSWIELEKATKPRQEHQ